MKTNQHFRLAQSTKRMMANFPKGEARNEYKRIMKDAQICEQVNKLRKKTSPTETTEE